MEVQPINPKYIHLPPCPMLLSCIGHVVATQLSRAPIRTADPKYKGLKVIRDSVTHLGAHRIDSFEVGNEPDWYSDHRKWDNKEYMDQGGYYDRCAMCCSAWAIGAGTYCFAVHGPWGCHTLICCTEALLVTGTRRVGGHLAVSVQGF
jgi:hypothetical protein